KSRGSFQQPIIFFFLSSFPSLTSTNRRTPSYIPPIYIPSHILYLFPSHCFSHYTFSSVLPPIPITCSLLNSFTYNNMPGLFEILKTFILCTLGLIFYFSTPIMYYFIVPAYGLQWYFFYYFFY